MNKGFLIALLGACLTSPVFADRLERDPFVITKDLLSNGGTPYASGGAFDLAGATGETTAGDVMTANDWELFPGYFGGGRLGGGVTIKILRTRVAPDARLYYQETLQVGVPLSGPVLIDFSDQIDGTSIPLGVHVFRVQNHLGQPMNEEVALTWTLDSTQQQLTLTSTAGWQGNSVYDIVINANIQSISGYTVDSETHVFFQTVLDPKDSNFINHPMNATGGMASAAANINPVQLDFPIASIRDYAAVVSTRDPMTTPIRVSAASIAEANRKARASSEYRIPLALREIAGYNSQGEAIVSLSKPIRITLGTSGGASGAASPATAGLIRPNTLSLWVLDEEHKLWVKIPASQVSPDGSSVSAPVSKLAVFAVMGSPSGVASEVYVFPNPWRPHGPRAGTNPGETGTESSGISFANLPSECRIKIYTLAGELVRELVHSDLSGSFAIERWDGKNKSAEAVVSGAYFWRVESETDSKNGKLLIIR